MNKVGAFSLTAVMIAGLSTAQAFEKKIAKAQLPAAVQKTAAEQSQGATIVGYSTEKEKGVTLYEVELKVDGHTKDVTMSASGQVVEVEEEVAFHSLSPEVQAGLKAAAHKGTLGKVESLTKGGKLVAYEAQVKNGAKKSEVQVGPDGGKLAHAE